MRSSSCVIVFLLLAISCSEKESRVKDVTYSICYNVTGWQLEASINEIPILRRNKGGGQYPISNLINNGKNVLRINAVQLKEDADPLGFMLKTTDIKSGKDVIICEDTIEPLNAGTTYKKSFDIAGQAPIKWSWELGETILAITENDKNEIYNIIKQIKICLEKKDLKEYCRLRSSYIEETTRLESVTIQQAEGLVTSSLNYIYKDNNVNVKAKDMSQLSMKACGKIVIVYGNELWPDDWVIFVDSNGSQYRIGDMLFARINGTWKMIN